MCFVSYPRQYFIAVTLVRLSKCLKQIIQMKINGVKNPPNWPEAIQLAIYKRGRGFDLGITVNKS